VSVQPVGMTPLPSSPTERRHRVVIVGGGFGGLHAARALRRAPVDVTLVDRANHHLFQPLLYQVAAGVLTEGEIAPPLRGVLRAQRNVRVLLADVRGFELEDRRVLALTPDGHDLALGYDTLIVAAGAGHSYHGHDEWEALAPGLKTLEDARRVRARVLGAFELAELEHDPEQRAAWLRFAVVGGGPTGVELAGQIASLAHRTLPRDYRAIDTRSAQIALLEAGPDVLPEFPRTLGRRAARDLGALRVDVRTEGRVTGLDAEGVELTTAAGQVERVPARTVIWAAGVQASPLAAALAEAGGATLDAQGRLRVEPDLTLPGHRDVVVVGDMTALDGVPRVAPAAMQQGRYAGGAVRARLRDRPVKPFRYLDKGSLAVIGHRRAVGVSFGIRFAGRLALLVWALIHVRYLLGWGNRLVTVVRWLWALAARQRAERVISPGPPAGLLASGPARS